MRNNRYTLIAAIYDTDEHISRLRRLIRKAEATGAADSLPMLQEALAIATTRLKGYRDLFKGFKRDLS